MPHDPRVVLHDVLRAAQLIREFTEGATFERYEADSMLRSAVERQFEIVGEALNKALAVDQVIICAGQEPDDELYGRLKRIGQPVHIIGGARKAVELDAESAIREGMELAYQL